jgi:hypothetical protein
VSHKTNTGDDEGSGVLAIKFGESLIKDILSFDIRCKIGK